MKKEDLGHFGLDTNVDLQASREAQQVGFVTISVFPSSVLMECMLGRASLQN